MSRTDPLLPDAADRPDLEDDDVADEFGGVDPLLVNPVLASGQTGQMERPGDDRPAWVIGVLFAAFCSLISGLVTLAIVRDDDAVDADIAAPTADSVADAAPSAEPADDSQEATEPAPTDVDVATEQLAADRDAAGLPDFGFVSLGGDVSAIDAACAVHLPLAPNEGDDQVSTYLFRAADGAPRVIDRRFGERDAIGATIGGAEYSFVAVTDIGDAGAFVATFVDDGGAQIEAKVNPDPDGGTDCDDTLVTNEPGQLAFPYTRIVMDVCTSGEQGDDLFVSGLTSEDGRFSARANGDETVTITYRTPEFDADLVDEAGSSFEREGRLGYSGIVTNGDDTLDITIDFGTDRADECPDA